MRAACTVVIPLYNQAGTIRRAVDSVLSQTMKDFEVLVIDDGSTDGGARAARSARDRRLRVVTQPRAGSCAARNRGLREARTDWVAFLDADDEWLPRFLERTLGFAQAHPHVAGVFTNILSVRDDEPWLGFPGFSPRVLDNYFAFVVRHWGRGMTVSSTLVRADAFKRAGGFPEGVPRSGDGDAWLRLGLAGEIGFIPEVLGAFHNEHALLREAFPEPMYPESVRTLRRLRAEGLIPTEHDRHLPRLEAIYLLLHARDLIDFGENQRARRLLFEDCRWRHCPPVPLAKALLRSLGV